MAPVIAITAKMIRQMVQGLRCMLAVPDDKKPQKGYTRYTSVCIEAVETFFAAVYMLTCIQGQ